MNRILVIDNYDSFTYNLVHYIESDGNFSADVYRNDAIPFSEIGQYEQIVLSPGPGLPSEAGSLLKVVRSQASTKKILGVCLGQQAICEAFGGRLTNLHRVYHGEATEVRITDRSEPIFEGLPEKFRIGRYHSWVIDKDHRPEELKITAVDAAGEIMAIRHRVYDIAAVQFHPESVLTEFGHRIIRNWLYAQ